MNNIEISRHLIISRLLVLCYCGLFLSVRAATLALHQTAIPGRSLRDAQPVEVNALMNASRVHTTEAEIDVTNARLNASFVTWNLEQETPRVSDCAFLRTLCRGDDLVFVGVQECEGVRPRREEGRRSRAWRVLQKYSLGPDFRLIHRCKMGGMQLAVFAKPCAANMISEIRSVQVSCGIGNIVTNKGALCALVRFRDRTENSTSYRSRFAVGTSEGRARVDQRGKGGQRHTFTRLRPRLGRPSIADSMSCAGAGSPSDLPRVPSLRRARGASQRDPDIVSGYTLAVVNAHLAAHPEQLRRRNKDYERIAQAVLCEAPSEWLSPSFGVERGDAYDADERRPTSSHDEEEDRAGRPGKARLRDKQRERKRGRSAMPRFPFSTLSSKRTPRIPARSGAADMASAVARDVAGHVQGLSHALGRGLRHIAAAASISPSPLRAAWARGVLGASGGMWPFDGTVFMGDLNYRVRLSPSTNLRTLKKTLQASLNHKLSVASLKAEPNSSTALPSGSMDRRTQALLQRDQLTQQIRSGRAFAGFSEEPIDFFPTYKYNSRSQEFDTSSKERTPSWTDRVLYCTGANNSSRVAADPAERRSGQYGSRLRLIPRYYSSVQECVHGDHRPVVAQFQIDFE